MKSTSPSILFLAAEADPLVKVGGLGDVAGSLPRAIRNLHAIDANLPDFDIRLALPYHQAIHRLSLPVEQITRLVVPSQYGDFSVEVYLYNLEGLPIYLIQHPIISEPSVLYSSDMGSDGLKYTLFSLAAMQLPEALSWNLDILHANDWHTAISCYQLSLLRNQLTHYKNTKSVLSLHNLPFMGAGTSPALQAFHIPPSNLPDLPPWAQHMPLPLGLSAADRIIAVSPTYAREVLTPEYGCNLQDFLHKRQDHITGILNGIDTESWNPETDPNLVVNFSSKDIEKRKINKRALQDKFNLPINHDIPLIIMISRLDQQKGIDIAYQALRLLNGKDWQAVILGTGDPILEEGARILERDYPNRVRAAIRFDASLARRMYASGDIILMPSRYEPCGLAQMMAMRYGCIPVAQATGGLKDSIRNGTTSSLSTGFLCYSLNPEDYAETILRAVECYRKPKQWSQLQMNAMAEDFSWHRSAVEYAKEYINLIGE